MLSGDRIPQRTAGERLVGYYYFATPLFFVADYVTGFDARAAFLDDETARYAYYALLMGLGVLAWLFPKTGLLTGILESGINLCLHIGAMFMAAVRLPERALQEDFAVRLADAGDIVAFFLIGGMLILSLRVRLATIERS